MWRLWMRTSRRFYPERAIRVITAGVGGNTCRDVAARWQKDVLDVTPDWVSLMIGINDVWRQLTNQSRRSAR